MVVNVREKGDQIRKPLAYNFHTSAKKRKAMSKVHHTGGKDELILRKKLWHHGVRYRTNYKSLPGSPDIAITKHKIAVFIDGEFWHGYNYDYQVKHIKKNREYWLNKIKRNMKRDQRVNTELEKLGYTVLRFPAKKVLKYPDYYVELILFYIRGAK